MRVVQHHPVKQCQNTAAVVWANRPRLHFDKQKANVTPSAPPPVPQINLEEQEVLKWRIESLCSLKILRAVSSVTFSRYKVQALWPITVRMNIYHLVLAERKYPSVSVREGQVCGIFFHGAVMILLCVCVRQKVNEGPYLRTMRFSDTHLMLLSNMRLNWFIDLFLCFIEFQDAISENSELHRPILPHG